MMVQLLPSRRHAQPRFRRKTLQFAVTVTFLCLLSLCSQTAARLFSGGSGGSNTVTIPRSTHHHHRSSEDNSYPPWNPSSQIDDSGFLRETYHRCPGEWEEEANIGGKHGPQSRRYKQLEEIPVQIRQVPGDGNCLFHSIATCLSYAVHGKHICMKDNNISELHRQSKELRKRAVHGLQSKHKLLFLQGHEYLRARDLVEAAASQYGLSGERYCQLMQQDSYWGGGPEIVALCNVLRRPIHVYELISSSSSSSSATVAANQYSSSHKQGSSFRLRRMACFGSPKFDRREPLHILSADSRFPDVAPGKQTSSGNHFLAVFPMHNRNQKNDDSHDDERLSAAKKAGVRTSRGGTAAVVERSSSSSSSRGSGRWKLATWVALCWTTFSSFWTKHQPPK